MGTRGYTRSGKRFIVARAVLAAGVIIAATAGTGCGGPFIEASGSFATAAETGVDALTPMFSSASKLCRARARLHYMFEREQKAMAVETQWSKWYANQPVEGGPEDNWKAHCEMLETSDTMLARGLEAIGAYAEALKAAAGSSGYDGKTLDDLVKNSAELAGTLSTNTTRSKKYTDVVAGLSGPIAFVGRSVAQSYASGKLRDAVRSGSPAVGQILGAIKAYNAAIDPSFDDAEKMLAKVLDQADASIAEEDQRIGRAKPDAMQVLAFHDTASRYESGLADLRRTWAAYGSAVEALSSANDALLGAAEGKMSDEDALKQILGFADEVVMQIATVKNVAARGKE